MIKSIDMSRLDEALGLLSERLRLDGAAPQEIVICGGSSLIARGYVSRATRDVDVLAWRLRGQARFISSRPLSETLVVASKRVAADLGLPANWFNDGPADLFEMGLPAGFEDRLTSRHYGSHLIGWFIDRIDQIHFKLYAAADQGPGQHVDDLLALKPTAHELLAASRWAFTHDVSPGFRSIVRDMLKQLGHEEITKDL